MGMSIDEAIEGLHDIQKCYNDDSEAMFLGFDDKDNKSVDFAIDTMRKYQQLEDFARWVATEVIDEEMWAYNHLAFTELACRKLVKLGIMQESDGEYTYEVVEDGDD